MLVGILSPSLEREQAVLAAMLDQMEVPHESVGAEAFVSRLGRYSALIVPSGCQALEDCTDEDIEEWLTPFTAEGGRVLLLAAGSEAPSLSATASQAPNTTPKSPPRPLEVLVPDHWVFRRPNSLSDEELQRLGERLRPSALPRQGGKTLLRFQGQDALVETSGWGDKTYCGDRRIRVLYCRLPLEALSRGEGAEALVALRLLENLVWHTLFLNFMVGHGLYHKKERKTKQYPAEISPRDVALIDLKRMFQTPQPRFRISMELGGTWRYSSDVSVDGANVSGHDFNPAAWREVRLPSLASDRGWFRTSFPLSQEWRGRNLLLEVGAGGEGEVWFNRQRAGAFVGSARLIQLPEAVFGERDNVLAIRSVGGPPNSVSLLLTSPVWIEEIVAAPDLENSEVGVDVTLRNSSTREVNGLLQAACSPFTKPGPTSTSEKLAFHLPPGKEEGVHLLVPVDNPFMWTPEHPDLYNLTTTLQTEDGVQDEVCTIFGMRTFGVKDGDFFLNGQRRFLRGAVDLGVWVAAGWEPTGRSLLVAKYLGADFSRAHRPDEQIATLCDFLGIMLIQGLGDIVPFHPRSMNIINERTGELATGWQRKGTGIVRQEFIRRSEALVRHLVRRLRHHPSIVMWELSDEVPMYLWEVWEKVYPRLMEAVRELDTDRRPVVPSSGSSPCDQGLRDTEVGWDISESETARHFFEGNQEAVLTSHLHCGWYNDRIQTIYRLPTTSPQRPLGMGEFGAESLPDFSTLDISPKRYNITNVEELSVIKYWTGVRPNLEDYRERSQEYQAVLLRTFLDHFRSLKPQVDGATVFTWMDSLGQHKGILDIAGKPKKAFWEVKEAFAPLIIVIRWEEKVVFAGETVSFPLTVVNDLHHSFFAALKWEIQGAEGAVFARGREEVRVEADSVGKPNPAVWEIPLSARGGFYYLNATLETLAAQTLCAREFEFQVVPRSATL